MAAKKTIYMITEVDRWEENTWLVGLPNGWDYTSYRFNFDTKYGDLEIDDIEDDIKSLEMLDRKFAGAGFDGMIKERKEWIAEQVEEERQLEIAQAQAINERLEAARRLLREAGELP